MTQNPFIKSYFRLGVAKIEFRYFKDHASDALVRRSAKTISRFDALEKLYSFYVGAPYPETLQLWFGNRSMFRKNLSGGTAVEKGPVLVYSLGPTGEVAVILYPASSSVANPVEDHIFLAIGRFSGYQLLKRLQGI